MRKGFARINAKAAIICGVPPALYKRASERASLSLSRRRRRRSFRQH